jgi:hypothetical protein
MENRVGTANEEPPRNDHESLEQVRERLFLWRLTERARRQVCIICGEVPAIGACKSCNEARRQKRIAEAGYDYYEGMQ